MFPKKSLSLIPVLAGVLLILSCGKSYDGYAVVLWTDKPETFSNGSIVGLIAHSTVRKEYQIETLNTDKPVIKPFDEWRLQVCDSLWHAEDYLKANKDYIQAFARSAKQALPVRKKADRSSDTVYRLREDEEVKILSREKDKRDEGGLVDYWYEILTQSGTRGWVFGYQLKTEDKKQASAAGDPLIALAKNNWRPKEYLDMIRDGILDLNTFGPDFGFFIQPEDKKVVMNLPKEQLSVSYTELTPMGKSSWKVGDSGMQVSLNKNGELYVEWLRKDKSVGAQSFVNFADNVQTMYDQEVARREKLIAALANASKNLSSDNFGNLSFQSDGSFVWTGFEALSPSVIPGNASGTGKAYIRYYLGNVLSSKFDGLLSMDFDLPTGPEEINFIYKIRSDGIRFEYVRKNQFKGMRLIENQANSQVVFFHY